MAHIQQNKKKIITRLRRIKGQLEAVERALEEDKDCYSILQTLAACRGGLNGLTGELIEEHVKNHVMVSPLDPRTPQDEAAIELVNLIKTYWK